MTAFAFIFGVIPLVAVIGSGAVARLILGTVVTGGMTAVTLIAVFLSPFRSMLPRD
ncbi:MAG: efflux RND transporter permease subunit [Syntrophobacteraceae bacterium]